MPDEPKRYDHGCGSGESCNLSGVEKGYKDQMMKPKHNPQDEMMNLRRQKDAPGKDI